MNYIKLKLPFPFWKKTWWTWLNIYLVFTISQVLCWVFTHPRNLGSTTIRARSCSESFVKINSLNTQDTSKTLVLFTGSWVQIQISWFTSLCTFFHRKAQVLTNKSKVFKSQDSIIKIVKCFLLDKRLGIMGLPFHPLASLGFNLNLVTSSLIIGGISASKWVGRTGLAQRRKYLGLCLQLLQNLKKQRVCGRPWHHQSQNHYFHAPLLV